MSGAMPLRALKVIGEVWASKDAKQIRVERTKPLANIVEGFVKELLLRISLRSEQTIHL